jgi:hypothetical protein
MSKEKESKDKNNYWNMKDEEIKRLIEERELPYDLNEFSRKTAIIALQISDVYLGDATDALEENEDGELVKTMRKKGYVKVRFHNTQDNDVPYLFIGHNGKAFYIPKEEDIWIPKYLLSSVIKDAIEMRSESKKVGNKMVQTVKAFQRFPYTLLSY